MNLVLDIHTPPQPNTGLHQTILKKSFSRGIQELYFITILCNMDALLARLDHTVMVT